MDDLTPEEKKELEQLRAELSPPNELSPEEQQELEALRAEQAPAQPEAEPSKIESFARGAVESATMGLAPTIEAALKSTLGDPFATEDKSYADIKAQAERAYQKAEKANPGSYTAGEVAGFIGSLVAGGAAVKGASKAAQGTEAVKRGMMKFADDAKNVMQKAGEVSEASFTKLSEVTGLPLHAVKTGFSMLMDGAFTGGAATAVRAIKPIYQGVKAVKQVVKPAAKVAEEVAPTAVKAAEAVVKPAAQIERGVEAAVSEVMPKVAQPVRRSWTVDKAVKIEDKAKDKKAIEEFLRAKGSK